MKVFVPYEYDEILGQTVVLMRFKFVLLEIQNWKKIRLLTINTEIS